MLKGYLSKLWVFESSNNVPEHDLGLIIPNDRIKLALPFKNGIRARVEGAQHLTKEHSFTVTGIMDKAFQMDIASDGSSGTICAEFSPYRAYRFFHHPLTEIRNKVFSLSDLLGNVAQRWEERIANEEQLDHKIALFQQFLLVLFEHPVTDDIFEYGVKRIQISGGSISLKELERLTGYSARWLNIKFKEKLGISPKELSSLIRFRNCYELLDFQSKRPAANSTYYNCYYDQTHYIKDFKRYTGLTPKYFGEDANKWGRLFYNV